MTIREIQSPSRRIIGLMVPELVPSLYLLTHDPREVLRGTFFDDAVAWADTMPVSALDEIRRACYRQMGAMFDVLPEVKGVERGQTLRLKNTSRGLSPVLPPDDSAPPPREHSIERK